MTFFKLLQIEYWLLAILHSSFSTRFVRVGSHNLDIHLLYYDFVSSNLGVSNKTTLFFGIKNSTHCSFMCLINFEFRCNGFSYSPQGKLCSLFSTLNSRNRNSSDLFIRIPDCPSNFVYLEAYNKCYYVIPGVETWSDARKKCNDINSHPVMLEDYLEVEALRYFISLPSDYTGLGPSCLDSYLFSWTAGIAVKANQTPFVWKPFQMKDGQEPYLSISYFNWAPNQPDNNMMNEYCLNLKLSVSLNDLSCQDSVCVVCEVDV